MRTLFLNPPSFENFDGGASSRWPATREIESYWYPVWLCYPAGMLPDSKVVDAPATQDHGAADRRDGEGLSNSLVSVYFKPGSSHRFENRGNDEGCESEAEDRIRRTPVTIEPEKALQNSAVDFVVRREFDYQIAGYAKGKPLEQLPGVSFRKNGSIIHNPEGGVSRISMSCLG